MFSGSDNSYGVLVLLAAVGFLPLIAVTVTAFAKVSIVLMLVRNALGLQQVPPNIVVYSLAVIISAFVALPVGNEALLAIKGLGLEYKTLDDWMAAAEVGSAPLKQFLQRYTDPTQIDFFEAAANRIWSGTVTASRTDFAILAPSFLLSEMTSAFVMGFKLFLPFMAIDIIVTTILVALGLNMVQPTTIALPFKLMLFVFLDGWSKIVQGLVMSYSA
jgi:type III secretion protein R